MAYASGFGGESGDQQARLLQRMKESSLARSIEHRGISSSSSSSSSMMYKTGRSCFRPLYLMCLSRTILVLGFLFVIWQSYNSEYTHYTIYLYTCHSLTLRFLPTLRRLSTPSTMALLLHTRLSPATMFMHDFLFDFTYIITRTRAECYSSFRLFSLLYTHYILTAVICALYTAVGNYIALAQEARLLRI